MFLKHKQSQDLIEVMDLARLFDPHEQAVEGRFHAGEEMQEREEFAKIGLLFPSGESLPACWLDPDYKR
jgi:hypothetical protein